MDKNKDKNKYIVISYAFFIVVLKSFILEHVIEHVSNYNTDTDRSALYVLY